ncbi:MAG TPA: hypothetical protein VE077_21340 [Candidatus Methylomirabilis sp.]|nr:hypothetical protein [Candidatus Methylomirabilis sp.]
MTSRTRHLFPVLAFLAAAALFAPLGARAQASSANSTTSASGDRWLHVRVISTNGKDETVKVNVPLELAEKVLPAIDHDRLHDGRVMLGGVECNGVDIRAVLDAVRTSKDGEFVTIQKKDADISVAKKNGQLLVHVHDKTRARNPQVEVKVPMKVVEALLSGSNKDELNIEAALHALASQGDVELVSVKDDENTVRVWVDSKNISD